MTQQDKSRIVEDPPLMALRGHSPHAHKASKKITVLHSRNDNIVGPLLPEDQQPQGVSAKEVWTKKPDSELLPGLLTHMLELGSLYEAANLLGVPVSTLLDDGGPEAAYLLWHHQP